MLHSVSESHFITPCSHIPAKTVPAGDRWVHEVKFDGYRVQAHKLGSTVAIYCARDAQGNAMRVLERAGGLARRSMSM